MAAIQVLLWDIDGTLLDFVAAEGVGIRKTFAKFHLGECTDEMLSVYDKINNKYWQMLERKECTKRETMVGRFREFFSLYGMDVDAEAFNDEYQLRLPETIVFRPHAWETVNTLSQFYRQICVTNGNLPVQQKKLRDSGLDLVFDQIYISDEVGHEKPSPEFFTAVLDGAACKPEEAMMIGDSLSSDMCGALRMGIPSCWYNPEGKPVPNGYAIDYVIRDLTELIPILTERN